MKPSSTFSETLAIGISVVFLGCGLSDLENRDSHLDLPPVPYGYQIGVTDAVPTLGRVLFYDPRISANNATSCASCHKQALAFTDDQKFSRGFKGELTLRNSMPIQNIVSTAFPFGVDVDSTGSFKSTSLFWDGRQVDLIPMVLEPIQNHVEMGVNNLDDLEKKITSISDYKPLFKNAFGSDHVDQDKIAIALSAFIVSIRSNNSRFDMALNGFNNLTPIEQVGQKLFFSTYDCNSCHQLEKPVNGYQFAGTTVETEEDEPVNVEAVGFADIGLDENPTDVGAFKKTGQVEDIGKFKIPSLRNIALTAPYMHDGRFKTLEEVIEHYSTDIEDSRNLDARLRDVSGAPKTFNIPMSDKIAIVAFLNTMTDYRVLSDPRFSNPFKVR